MEMIGLYMRISSEDIQVGESDSICNQRDLLYDFIRSCPEFEGCSVMEFCDDGYSGMNFERPGMQKLLSLLGSCITCIVVKDFSRFGRNLVEVGDYLDQVFPFLGVRFIAINEGYDSKKNIGRSIGLEVSLKAMISEWYSRDISEKIRCVQQVKMRKGEYLCGIAFYGYQRSQIEKNKLVIDPAAAEVVRRIFYLASEGNSMSEIAVKLNKEGVPSPLMYRRERHTDGLRGWNTVGEATYWTRDNVKRIVTDKRYTGCLVSRKRTKEEISTKQTRILPQSEWIVVENTQEAIVSKELFIQAQKGIRHRVSSKISKKTRKKYFEQLRCAYCGRKLEQSRGKRVSYFCPTKRVVLDSPCTKIVLEKQKLEQVLLGFIQIQMILQSLDLMQSGQIEENFQRKIQDGQLVIRRYQAMRRNAFEDLAEGRIEQQKYLSYKKELTRQQEETIQQNKKLIEQIEAIQQEKESIKQTKVVQYPSGFEKEFVQVIWVYREERVEIVWNFQDIFYGNPNTGKSSLYRKADLP